MAKPVERLTRLKLADRFGVDIRTVTNWVNDGMPQRMREGEPCYVWAECYKWREQQIRSDARATRHAGGDASLKKEMAEARLRALLAEAEKAEYELALIRGDSLTMGFVTTEFERLTQQLRSKLLGVPAEWPEYLTDCRTTVDFQKALRERVNVILPMLDFAVRADAETEAESRPAKKRKAR